MSSLTRRRIVRVLCALLVGGASWPSHAHAQHPALTVVVVDESNRRMAGADWSLQSTQGAVVRQGVATGSGTFTIAGVPRGTYQLDVSAPHFRVRRMGVAIAAGAPPLTVVLDIAPVHSEVAVTAERATFVEIEGAAPVVIAIDEGEFRRGPLTTIGDALEGAAGVMVQQSAHGQVSPFLRGLTGYHVLNLIDGVRFNNSTFRSGPNQYLAFAAPGQAQRVEAVLGPASSQFGSDALGGAIQVLTPVPPFIARGGAGVKGGLSLVGATADQSRGADTSLWFVSPRLSGGGGASWKRSGDLRAGGGTDSHHVLRRLFGLSGGEIQRVTGERQPGTGFTQQSVHTKIAAHLPDQQNLTFWYQRSALDGVRGTKDLWGGLGRLRSDFEPQGLQFLYGRYEKLGAGPLDWLSGTVSVNAQRDGTVRQGQRATDRVVRDDTRVAALGYSVQAGTHVGERQAIVFGGEIYDEHVDARRQATDPRTGAVEEQRALYPNGSRYRTAGLFAQSALNLGTSLRAVVGGRFTRVVATTFADRNRTSQGRSLGVIDATSHHQDWTFNAGLTWQPADVLSVHALAGRGFRAPNLNDLGALGLNDLGYEVPAGATVEAGGLIGAGDGEGVMSSGRRIGSLSPERLLNYEVGTTLRWPRLQARANVFHAELSDPIVRRTLLFQADQVPASLAGLAVTPIPPTSTQREQGVVSVATAFDARAVKAFVNDGRARYDGLDALFSYRLSARWRAEGNYSYLVGHDLDPVRPTRRLPPQQGALSLRFRGGDRLPRVEAHLRSSGAQEHLSGGDLTDERIGASRRRGDITDFFQGGLVSPFVRPGSDGRLGTDDDVFAPTSETLAQIRDRVLPIGATINGVRITDDNTRVPLYLRTPAFVALHLRMGVTMGKHVGVNLALDNALDRNYRVHGSGVDAAGINVFAGLNVTY